MHELLIRNALLLDGLGSPAVRGDLAVSGARIREVGKANVSASETIDADGLALMPGIIDNHTHYDAQITWDAGLAPSPQLGVTTAVIGNCGFTIAPCRAADRELVMRNLTQVEGMSLEVLRAGAVGFSTSTSPAHNGEGGLPMPSRLADENELRALVGCLKDAGRGVFMLTKGGQTRIAFLEELAAQSTRPVVIAALLHNSTNPGAVFQDLDAIRDAGARGGRAALDCRAGSRCGQGPARCDARPRAGRGPRHRLQRPAAQFRRGVGQRRAARRRGASGAPAARVRAVVAARQAIHRLEQRLALAEETNCRSGPTDVLHAQMKSLFHSVS